MTAVTNPATEPASQDWLLEPVLAPTVTGDVLAPYYEAAARGELAMPFCSRCDLALELEQRVCDGCGGTESQWRTVEVAGTVHAAPLMHPRETGLVRAEVPHPVATAPVTLDADVVKRLRAMMREGVKSGSAKAAAAGREPVYGVAAEVTHTEKKQSTQLSWFIGWQGDLAVAVMVKKGDPAAAAAVAGNFFAAARSAA